MYIWSFLYLYKIIKLIDFYNNFRKYNSLLLNNRYLRTILNNIRKYIKNK